MVRLVGFDTEKKQVEITEHAAKIKQELIEVKGRRQVEKQRHLDAMNNFAALEAGLLQETCTLNLRRDQLRWGGITPQDDVIVDGRRARAETFGASGLSKVRFYKKNGELSPSFSRLDHKSVVSPYPPPVKPAPTPAAAVEEAIAQQEIVLDTVNAM